MGLERVNQVRTTLGLTPSFPIITVGGTNGKGSTCAMLEAILSRAGYRVGCYTSPHLLRYNERVRIAQQEASDEQWCQVFAAVEAARISSDVSLTYFEFGTLAAMQLFIQAGVEVAILEVGLGGRLDAVNIFDADCAVLTSIGLDHMEYLGDTREKIGFEKAGIFRSGQAAICSDPDVPDSIRQHANAIGANFMHIGEHFGYSANTNHSGQAILKDSDLLRAIKPARAESYVQWDFWGAGGKRHSLPHPAMRGAFQLQNASACLAALDIVKDRLPVSMSDIRQGLLEAALPGRFQVLPGRPVTVLDVAHNPSAAQALAANLGNMGFFQNTYAIFGMLRDKDMAGVARALRPGVDVWLAAGINAPRGASAAEIAQVLEGAGIVKMGAGGAGPIHTFPDPASAYAFACEQATENDRICVFGSFHTVGDVLRYRNSMKHKQ